MLSRMSSGAPVVKRVLLDVLEDGTRGFNRRNGVVVRPWSSLGDSSRSDVLSFTPPVTGKSVRHSSTRLSGKDTLSSKSPKSVWTRTLTDDASAKVPTDVSFSGGVELESRDISVLKESFPFTLNTMHAKRAGVSVNMREAVSNFRRLQGVFEKEVAEKKSVMMSQVINGWLSSVKSLYGTTSEGKQALRFIQQHFMGHLYSGKVDRAVLKLAADDTLPPESRKIGLKALQTLKTLNDRTLTLAATRVVREDFYKNVETWDPISAIAFVDMTNSRAKVAVLSSMMESYGASKEWLDAVNVAVRQEKGSIKHYTSHPSSSFSKETAQSDSDLVMALAELNGTHTHVEHMGKFVPADIDTEDGAIDITVENFVLMLSQKGASPSYSDPMDNWVNTIEEHYRRDLRSVRQEASDILDYAADIYSEEIELKREKSILELDSRKESAERILSIEDRLDKMEVEKDLIRLLSRSLAEEMNSWAPDVDSRPADVAAMARMRARLTSVGLRHNKRQVRNLALQKTGVWERALSEAIGAVQKTMRQSEGKLKLMVAEVDAAIDSPKEILEAVSRNMSKPSQVYKEVRRINQERYEDLRALRRQAIDEGDFFTEMATRVGISASRPGEIGEQVRFAYDAMQGLVDAFRSGRPIGNKELGRCLAILKMHKEFHLNMFVVAEATVDDHSSISYLLSKVGSNGIKTHGAPLRERPEAFSSEAVDKLVNAIQNGDVKTVRGLFIGDSDSRGDGEATAGAVTADTHRMVSRADQSIYRGAGCSKLRGIHTEDGAAERTADRVVRDAALRVKDVKETKDGFSIKVLPQAYTAQPHRTILQLTEGSLGDSRFQSVVTALFPLERLSDEYSGHVVDSLMPAINASVRVGEQQYYDDIASSLLDTVKDFMATLAKRPNTRSDYTRLIDGKAFRPEGNEDDGPQRFAERVRAVQQAACEYVSPLQSMGLVRQLETFRYIATMAPSEFEVFKASPTGYQFESLVKRYPVLDSGQIDRVADEYRYLGVSEESISHTVEALKESVTLLQQARDKYGYSPTLNERRQETLKLESKEVYAKEIRHESHENGASDAYFVMMTNFLSASGA